MTNPTTGQSQFTNPIHLDNVTPGAPLQSPILGIPQFANPIHLDDITFETFPNPTLGIRQFKDPIHLNGGLLPIPNPTLTGNLSKETAIHLDGNTPVTFPNPTLFATPTQFTEDWDINNTQPGTFFPGVNDIQYPNPTTQDTQQFTEDWDINNNNEAIDGSGPGTGVNDIQYPSPLNQTPLNPESGVPLPTQYNTDESSFYYSGELNERYRNWSPAAGVLGQSQETRGYESSNFVPPAFVGTVASNVGARLGIPFASSIVNSSISNYTIFDTPYRTLPFNRLNTRITPKLTVNGDPNLGSIVEFLDFRSRFSTTRQGDNTEGGVFQGENVESALSFLSNKRADGSFAVARNLALKVSTVGVSNLVSAGRAAAYAAAAISPAGAYSVFNLKASGQFGSGWGDHDNPYAIRNDFTAGSEVSTVWYKKTGWNSAIAKVNPDALLPFRGDKVNVIDFKRHDNAIDGSGRTLKEAYQWKKTWLKGNGVNNRIQQIIGSDTLTKDFIKFYLTGPKLQNGLTDTRDDIMVFRASVSSLRDSFQAGWTPNTLIGRADPNYTYTGYSRDFSLNFDVFATSRDELKFIWRKLNALAGYTAPEYNIGNSSNIALRAPWMRLTLGDLFVQQPVVLQSLSFDYDTEASWEINIEGDGSNMQVPFKISVACQFNMITDYLPQKGGRFFTLAKRFDADGHPYEGTDNWLSDFLGNVESPDVIKKKEPNTGGPTALSDVQDVTGQSGTVNSKKTGN